jgi:hypothetical protein
MDRSFDELIVSLTDKEKSFLFRAILKNPDYVDDVPLVTISKTLSCQYFLSSIGSNRELMIMTLYKKITGIEVDHITEYRFTDCGHQFSSFYVDF